MIETRFVVVKLSGDTHFIKITRICLTIRSKKNNFKEFFIDVVNSITSQLPFKTMGLNLLE